MKPMAEADLPHKCPTCRRKAPSERGAPGRPLSGSHRGGCNCCSGRSLRYNKQPTR